MGFYSVAVDGPAGSGKSTIAKLIAKELNIVYIDTGAMYRAVALYCIRKGIDTKDAQKVSSVLDEIKMDIKPENGGQRIYLSGEDVTDDVRSQKAGARGFRCGSYRRCKKQIGIYTAEYGKRHVCYYGRQGHRHECA